MWRGALGRTGVGGVSAWVGVVRVIGLVVAEDWGGGGGIWVGGKKDEGVWGGGVVVGLGVVGLLDWGVGRVGGGGEVI